MLTTPMWMKMRQNLQSRWLQKQCNNTTSLKPKSWKTRMMPASRTRWLEHCQYWTTNAVPTSCFRDLVVDLEDAISTFFDCKAFSSQDFFSIKWTLYGVVEHTVSAAMEVWAWPLDGVCARNSCCLGVVHGLKDTAKTE